MTISVDVVTTAAGLAELAPVWDSLVSRAGFDHPFVTHDWIRTWWECFGGDADQLCIVVVRADGEPIAIAPLMRTTARIYGKRMRCLRLLANDHTPRCDFIVASHSDEAYDAIWNFVTAESPAWDAIQLRELRSDSRTLRELTMRANQSGLRSGVRHTADPPFLRTTTGWDSYVESLPPKRRWFLRNRMKRLSKLGTVSLETITAGSSLADALDEGFRLEAAAWKKQAGTAILCDERTVRFYSLLAERAAASGWLRLQFLKVGERRVAFAFCLAYSGRMYLLKPGFDFDYAAYSPGTLLCYLALQDTFESGFAAYDFLGEADEWKCQWTDQTATHSSLFLYADRPWSRLAHYTRFAVVPALQQFPLYVRLRNRMFGASS